MEHVRLVNASNSQIRSYPPYQSELFSDPLYLEELGFMLATSLARARHVVPSLEVRPKWVMVLMIASIYLSLSV